MYIPLSTDPMAMALWDLAVAARHGGAEVVRGGGTRSERGYGSVRQAFGMVKKLAPFPSFTLTTLLKR